MVTTKQRVNLSMSCRTHSVGSKETLREEQSLRRLPREQVNSVQVTLAFGLGRSWRHQRHQVVGDASDQV